MTQKQIEKRNKLKHISKIAIANFELNGGICNTVNEMILLYIYNIKNNLQFHSYRAWQEKGYQVKKGSKAYLIWGRPLKKNKDKDKKPEDKDKLKETDFFPVAYIFSSQQVEKIK